MKIRIFRYQVTFGYAINGDEAAGGAAFELEVLKFEQLVTSHETGDLSALWMFDLHCLKIRNV